MTQENLLYIQIIANLYMLIANTIGEIIKLNKPYEKIELVDIYLYSNSKISLTLINDIYELNVKIFYDKHDPKEPYIIYGDNVDIKSFKQHGDLLRYLAILIHEKLHTTTTI